MRIAFIGFGEAARAFVETLRANPQLQFAAYDVLLAQDNAAAKTLLDQAGSLGVVLAPDAATAVGGADWVVSAVTASSSLDAGKSVAAHLSTGQVFIDVNSVSAGRKVDTAAIVCAGGAVYVDMAVMAPVHPRGHRTPVLLAGPACEGLSASFAEHGFDFSIVGAEIGAATSIKMLRSLFVKGMEALTVQTLMAAKAAGRFDEVYASLSGSFPQLGWPEYPKYQLERVARHGVRRAAEMRESAVTLDELGFAAGHDLAAAIADFQGSVGGLGHAVNLGDDVPDLYEGLLGAFRAR